MEAGADVNKTKNDGASPLFIASQEGHLEIVKALIAAGADINKKTYEYSPLYMAAVTESLEIVEALLAAGADVNIYNVLQKAREGKFKPEINALIIAKVNTLSAINQPANAPLKCFDPLMANEVNISISENAIFYIQDSTEKTAAAGCLDEDTLKTYKSEPSYVFYKCKRLCSSIIFTNYSQFCTSNKVSFIELRDANLCERL